MSIQEKKYTPSKYQLRSSIFNDLIQQRLGVLDFDENFDNEFQEFKLVMKFVIEVQEAIEQDIIPLKQYEKSEFMPNPKAVSRMDQIWNGVCFYGITWNNDNKTSIRQKVFCYDTNVKEINGFPVHDFIPIPKLRNMVPIGQIDDKDNWGIQIRELYPLLFAWEGANYYTIVNDAKMMYATEPPTPKITQADMFSRTKKTYILHKPVYHRLMNDMTEFFRKNSVIFQMNMQVINKWMDEDMGLEEFRFVTDTEDNTA